MKQICLLFSPYVLTFDGNFSLYEIVIISHIQLKMRNRFHLERETLTISKYIYDKLVIVKLWPLIIVLIQQCHLVDTGQASYSQDS